MHRSASWNRVSEDYFMHRMADDYYNHKSSGEGNDLPAYDPMVEMARKEKSRIKFAENAVHLIPLVLLLCALVLWFFSNPDVEVGVKVDSMAARIEGLTIEGDIDTDSDGTQIGFLPTDLGDLDTPNQTRNHKSSRKLMANSLKSSVLSS